MTEKKVKQLEDQIEDLKAQVKRYREEEQAKQIMTVEQEWVGKTFKKYDEERNKEIYIRVITAMINESPYQVECIEFEINPTLEFKHKSDMYNLFRRTGKFDYGFDGEPFIWIEEELIKDIADKYEPVSMRDYSNAYEIFTNRLFKVITKEYLLKDVFGGKYAQEVEES